MNQTSGESIFVYYFSGTGNSANAVYWVKQIAEEQNRICKLINLSESKNRNNIERKENAIIGFVSPTHGFNFPPLMFHFLLRLPRANNNKVFIMNTRGGLKMGNLFVPGLSGMAQYFSALILKIKGYKIIGMLPVDLPSNWISIHPGIKAKVVKSIYEKRESQVKAFADEILNGEKNLRALRDILQDLLITPISILYYFFGRFFLAKSFFASKDCSKCNLCIEQCPVKAIKEIDGRPFWTYKCESCMQCMNHCPERAIETAHGFLIGVSILTSSFILFKLYTKLGIHEIFELVQNLKLRWLLELLFDSSIYIMCVYIAYHIIHYLMRFRFIERMMVYTSLTTYRFWRRYQPFKLGFRIRKRNDS